MDLTGIITGIDCTSLSFVSFFFCDDEDKDNIFIIIAPITLKQKILDGFISGKRVKIEYEDLKYSFHHPNLDGDVSYEAKDIIPIKSTEE